MASMLLWVVTCICTPAMAKGVIEIRASFQAVKPKCRGVVPAAAANHRRSLHAPAAVDSPLRGGGASGPATIGGLGFQTVNGRQDQLAAFYMGSRAAPEKPGRETDKGPEGERGLCRGCIKACTEGGTIASA